MKRTYYHSTNRDLAPHYTPPVTFKDALFMGLAPDEGLFMPKILPSLTKQELKEIKHKPYSDVAFLVLNKFLYHDIEENTLRYILEKIYNFKLPIEPIDNITYLIRLDQGPTASFKDFGAQFMAQMMAHLKTDSSDITVLVATSGDTGSAVGEAFRDLEGFKVYLLYPKNEVSKIQEHQLTSIGNNIQAIAIDGKFDDCQALVKSALSDNSHEFLHFTSANSINIGRVLPQIVYYVYAYINIARNSEPMVFSIPSGNFGNSLGCEIARRMGLPVKKIIIAVNENDEFPKFLNAGSYQKVSPSRNCLSNAMNVGNPSNLARYFDFYGGILTKEGTIHKQPNLENMKKKLFSVSVSDVETVDTIIKMNSKNNLLIEPHGAVGIYALQKYRENNRAEPAICIETAHPAKFPEVLEEVLHAKIDSPPSLLKYKSRSTKVTFLNNNYIEFKSYLLDNK